MVSLHGLKSLLPIVYKCYLYQESITHKIPVKTLLVLFTDTYGRILKKNVKNIKHCVIGCCIIKLLIVKTG